MGAPELHRSGHTPVDPDHAAEVAEKRSFKDADAGRGPVPPDNQPGHHPRVDQDKPQPSARPSVAGGSLRFPFDFDARVGILARMVGVRPNRAGVELDDRSLTVRFGRWTLRTDLENIAGVDVTGPYAWWKVAGPPHLSIVDRGITFATTSSRGLCITFHEPVPALLPIAAVRHPSTTVTVADPEGLADAIEAAAGLSRT